MAIKIKNPLGIMELSVMHSLTWDCLVQSTH
jgi:hypothetical protein